MSRDATEFNRESSENFDKMTVEEFLKFEEQERIKMMNELVKIQRRQTKKLYQDLLTYKQSLEKQGITLNAREEQKWLEKQQKVQQQQEKENLLNYYKEYSAIQKKKDKEDDERQKKEIETWKEIKRLMQEAEDEASAGNTHKAKELEKQAIKLEKQEETKKKREETLVKGLNRLCEGINKLDSAVNQAISTYASYQQAINTRLQGTKLNTVDIWGEMNKKNGALQSVAYSPLYKTEELYSNLATLVEEGIAANIEQRAFLQTVSKGIARTFDANDASLKRIIRLQQYDSTAARLGMESYLTQFMNELVKNTEYLNSTFDNVTASLMEATSLMNAQASTEFEYTVQKWLGTLTGVGLSESTAQSIAQAIGYLGSGNISALSGSAMQNLLVMAASRNPSLNISDLLSGGMTAIQANELLGSVVAYLQDIGNTASNNVVLSEMASMFGVSVSDLVAARNIDKDTAKALYGNMLSYSGMYDTLYAGMRNYAEITGAEAILENLFGNFTFGQGMTIASSPALYSLWKITDMIQSVTGGIPIPTIMALGSGIDLNTSVENLMKIGIIGASTLGSIGDIVNGLSSIGNKGAENLLTKLGIGATSEQNVIARGIGLAERDSGLSTSVTTFVGNTEGEDYKSSAMSQAMDEAREQAKDQEPEDNPQKDLRDMFSEGGTMYILLNDISKDLSSIKSNTDLPSTIAGM